MDPDKALAHAGPGHHLVMAVYGPQDNPQNVAVECLDCGSVVVDADIYQDEQEARVWTVTIYPWDADPATTTFVFGSREDGEAFAAKVNEDYPDRGMSGNLSEPVEAWPRAVESLDGATWRLRALLGEEDEEDEA